MGFDISTATPVAPIGDGGLKQAGKFDISTARPASVDSGKTSFEQFRETGLAMSQASEKLGDVPQSPEAKAGRGIKTKDIPQGRAVPQEKPDMGFLHAAVQLAGSETIGKALNIFGYEKDYSAPFKIKKATGDASKVESEIALDHPIAAIVAGTAPFIATAPLFPEGLLGLSANFAAVGGLSELGKQNVDESLMKPKTDKALAIGKETVKGGLMGPIWHYSEGLQFIGRPFASALVKSGVRGAGTATLDAAFGDDLGSAFKQGGIMTALSLMFETPSLAKTVLGRGIVAKANNYLSEKEAQFTERQKNIQQSREQFKAGDPLAPTYPSGTKDARLLQLDPDAPDMDVFKRSLVGAVTEMSKDIKGKPVEPPAIVKESLKKANEGRVLTQSERDAQDYVLNNFEEARQNYIKKSIEEFESDNVISADIGKFAVPGMRAELSADYHEAGSAIKNFREEELLKDDATKDLPVAFTAGGSGSGKSNILKFFASQNHSSLKNAFALVHDVNLNNFKAAMEKINRALDTGRDVGIIYVYRDPLEAYTNGVIPRVITQDRIVPIKDHIDTHEGSLPTVRKIAAKFDGDARVSFRIVMNTQGKGQWFETPLDKVPEFDYTSIEDKLYTILKEAYESGKINEGHFQTALKGSPKLEQRAAEERRSGDLARRSETGDEGSQSQGQAAPGLNPLDRFLTPHQPPEITNEKTLALADKSGQIDVSLLPGVPELSETLTRSHEELVKEFSPYAVNDPAKYTAATLRQNLGRMAMSHDRIEHALEETKKFFDKATVKSTLDFIDRMESGNSQTTPELTAMAKVFRDMLDNKRKEVQDLGTGKLEDFIENYFPHIWERPGKAASIIRQIMGRRPLEGPKSFLKKRTIPTIKEGIDAGLVPVSYNPVDLTMLKIREMDRYVMAQKTIQALKYQKLVQFVRLGGEVPDGFVKINDKMSTVYSKNDAGELVLRGNYYAQRDAARILNNYLSPGLRGNYFYDLYRGAGNTLNQFQLGLSAFHLGFTSMDATISKFALGINRLSTGDVAGAAAEFVKAPFAPVTNFLQGRQLLQAWYGEDKGPLTNQIAQLMATAGGRAKMDKFYSTEAHGHFQKALKDGKLLTAATRIPWYIVEQCSRPIMEYIVPRQKLGVFMDMMKFEIENNLNMSHAQFRDIAQKAWDSVDNRMGQLVYDNLFWERTTKDLAMASVRSLGWNLGTVRELGGGVKDVIGNVADFKNGKSTRMSYRTAYLMALPMITGLYGAIYQYLHTGQGPQELKDYYFPKNGGVDNKGQEARISLPTYMKDIYHYTTNPVQTVLNKFSPVNNAVLEMMANKDFYGTEIRNMDDPIMQQVLDEATFAAKEFLPFGFRNLGRDTRKTVGSKVEPFVGITPAPYDINMTAAEKDAYEINKDKVPIGARTKASAKHSQEKSKVRSEYMASKDPAVLAAAVRDKVISSKEKTEIVKESKMSNLERLTRHMTVEEVMNVTKRATAKERVELEKILKKKKANKQGKGSWSSEDQEMYDNLFNNK